MTDDRKRILEKVVQKRGKAIIKLLNTVNFQSDELTDLQNKYKRALLEMHECAHPCAFCGHSDDGDPRDQYDEGGDFKCYCCDNNGGDVDNWEFICEVEKDTPADAPPESPYLFKDGICPHCGGDTHGINDAPMQCGECGWTERQDGNEGAK